MELTNTTDILIFMNKKHICENIMFDDYASYCKLNNRMCDYDHCSILKRCNTIDDFINILDHDYQRAINGK